MSESNLKLQNLDQEHNDLQDEIHKYNMRLKNRVKNTAKLKRDLTENAEELERLTITVKQKKAKLQRSNKTLIEMEEELNEKQEELRQSMPANHGGEDTG